MMFGVLLFQHWKSVRLPLFVVTVAAFAVPVVAATATTWADPFGSRAGSALWIGGAIGIVYPLLGTAVGLLMAWSAWAADLRGGHVYAMTLPLRRSRYAALRFWVGALILSLPVLALTAGALSASALVVIPDGLTAYPIALGVRFGLATLVAFALFFAIAAGSSRAAGYVLLALVALPLLQGLLGMIGLDVNILRPVGRVLFDSPGLLDIFGGRWMLIDV